MLLIVTNGEDATADYLQQRLAGLPIRVVRLNTESCAGEFVVRYAGGRATLSSAGMAISPSEIRNVWFRRPQAVEINLSPDDAENRHLAAEHAEALEGFLGHVPVERWMNHPTRNSIASHKIEQLSRASAAGLLVPRSFVTRLREEATRFLEECGRIVAKPLSCGWIERSDKAASSVIYTSEVMPAELALHGEDLGCPTLLQERIRKESDIRVTVVDGRISASSLKKRDKDGSQELDIRRDNMAGVEYETVSVSEELCEKIRKLVESYELRFAAIDFVVDSAGDWYFLEINPNGQWAWLDLVGGASIWRAFAASFAEDRAGA